MNLKEYFEKKKGFGVLSTADGKGRVNSAIYARPHVMEDGTLAFIMPDRLTHRNLRSNPHAAYLFREDEPGYKGTRIHMTRVREETDSALLHSLRRRSYPPEMEESGGPRFVVLFEIDRVLPLIGPGESELK
ncbi:MAG: pyridoxamine 5'-phosphate oxidase family protein [Deltaproteobacteria bacterium]|nr:pyridoxamine 5'-phosphate oxidase family protein [Deltaproteobacteria bacterium]